MIALSAVSLILNASLMQRCQDSSKILEGCIFLGICTHIPLSFFSRKKTFDDPATQVWIFLLVSGCAVDQGSQRGQSNWEGQFCRSPGQKQCLCHGEGEEKVNPMLLEIMGRGSTALWGIKIKNLVFALRLFLEFHDST